MQLVFPLLGADASCVKTVDGAERCNNPYMARSPVEATGINILKSMEKYNFFITFPPKDKMTRCGLLLW